MKVAFALRLIESNLPSNGLNFGLQHNLYEHRMKLNIGIKMPIKTLITTAEVSDGYALKANIPYSR